MFTHTSEGCRGGIGRNYSNSWDTLIIRMRNQNINTQGQTGEKGNGVEKGKWITYLRWVKFLRRYRDPGHLGTGP